MDQSDFNLNRQNDTIESKVVASLERISQAFRVLLWKESKEFSLTPIQVQVLTFVLFHASEKCKVSYLADEFNMTKATVSDTVKTLEQKNLIFKEFEPLDNRSYTIHLTETGKHIARQTSFFSKEIRTPIQNLHKTEKETLMLSLFDIIRHLNESGVITIQRMCTSCSFYRLSKDEQTHFCTLLNQRLNPTDLRIDCPEYQMA